jgi:hypothetical protein
MLVTPRDVDRDEGYFPYKVPSSTQLYLFNGILIKSKYNQRDKTKGSELLYRSVNYINSMKFRINDKMLKLVLNERNKIETIIFKCFNFILDIKKINSYLFFFLFNCIVFIF